MDDGVDLASILGARFESVDDFDCMERSKDWFSVLSPCWKVLRKEDSFMQIGKEENKDTMWEVLIINDTEKIKRM